MRSLKTKLTVAVVPVLAALALVPGSATATALDSPCNGRFVTGLNGLQARGDRHDKNENGLACLKVQGDGFVGHDDESSPNHGQSNHA